MKIISLHAENVKRLKAVDITPRGPTVVVGGFNGQGKSSVLDSIMYALAGGDSLPDEPLRRGENKGEIVVNVGDMIITRKFSRFTDDSIRSTLEIKTKDGFKASSPQAILNSLVGNLAFDPLEFSRLKPRDQLDSLKQLVGLDFALLDHERSHVFDKRTETNRSMKSKTAELEAMKDIPDEKPAPVSVAHLTEELARIEKHNGQVDAFNAKLAAAQSKATEDQARVAKLEQMLQQAKVAAQESKAAADALTKQASSLAKIDSASIHEKIRGAESINESARAWERKQAAKLELDALTKSVDELTNRLAAIDKSKSDAMSKAPFPVPGLGFGSDGVTLNGLPFEQASSAEKLRVSVAMGLALKPKLPVMLIRDGSLLDKDSLQMVGEMAAKANAQLWIERVGIGEEVSVIIEDGTVRDDTLDETPATQVTSVADLCEL